MSSLEGKYYSSTLYHIIYSELITAARYRGTVTYQEIAKIMGLPLKGSYMGNEIGKILGEISKEEGMHGRPMLSAIAIGVSGEPGKGFYALAKELGKEFNDDTESKRRFWNNEKQAVYHAWKRELKA